VIIGLWPASALAQGSPSESLWASRPLALEAHVGIGTPVGFAGGYVEYALAEAIAIGAGAGAGSGSNWLSLHLGAGVRWRALLGELNAGYVALEYSTGGYRDFESYSLMPSGLSERWTDTEVTADRAHWLEPSLGWEHRWRSGVVFRAYYGAAFMLNPGGRDCVETHYERGEQVDVQPCTPDTETVLPFFGIAIGYAFRGS